MSKFLIPLDGSEPNSTAVKGLGTYLSHIKDDVELHLLTVQPPIPYGNRVSSVIGRDRIARYHEEDGLAALEPARKLLDAAGVRYRHSIGVGDPAEVIVDYAKKND